MSLKLITAKNLTKSFGDFIAVDNIDLDVKRGEVLGFLGPNGAGKSTTMKMLTGFLEPDKGTIEICDIDLQKNPLKAKEFIGYLPEGAPAYSDMEVSDFLSFVGKMRGMENSKLLKSRLSDMAEQINLKEVWNRPIETLSKGFKRRVGIAQALIHDPDILILDEPTDGLDPNQKYEMRNLIKNISQNKAIVISTHILEEVEAVCSRAIIIADGKILANETPENLVNKFLEGDFVSIITSNIIDKKLINDIKSTLNYKTVKIESHKKNQTQILIKDEKNKLNLNKIMNEIKKYKLDINEAGFLKSNLDDVFRKITQQQ